MRAHKVGLVAGAGGVALAFFLATGLASGSAELIAPETVEVAPRVFLYRLAGDFRRAGQAVDAPAVTVARRSPVRIMRWQVTAEEYARCVASGNCKPTSLDALAPHDSPAANVSWSDATDFARWLSKETGYSWRLPTDEEWAFAAGSRFHDDALSISATADPSARWLARYAREADGAPQDRRLRPIGSFGENEYGLQDLSGNVWEWTNSCFVRQQLGESGNSTGASTTNCGVRVVEGRHRGYVADFIRDASSGGCAAGRPPSNLGFRLVREDRAETIGSNLRRMILDMPRIIDR